MAWLYNDNTINRKVIPRDYLLKEGNSYDTFKKKYLSVKVLIYTYLLCI